MDVVLFIAGLIFLLICVQIIFKIGHKIIYLILFYFPVKLTNKILYWYFHKEKVQIKLQRKGQYRALRTLWRTFKNMQLLIGWILIGLYTFAFFFLAKENFISYMYISTFLVFLFLMFVFFLGKPSYKIKKQKENKYEDSIDISLDAVEKKNNQEDMEIQMMEDMQVEGLGDVDFGDMISDIDFSIDISLDL